MNLLNEVLKSNQQYWSKENYREHSEGVLLYENFYNSPQLCYGISKVALCIAKSMNLEPAVFLPWKKSKDSISESMCGIKLQMRNHLVKIIVMHFFSFMKVFFITPKRLLNYSDGHSKIGPYIYDSILRKYNKKTNISFSFNERVFLCIELCYYFYFKYIIRSLPVKVAVLGDNVYRYGLIFELCKIYGIKCYSPVDLNSLYIRCFSDKNDFDRNLLTKDMVNKLCNGVDYSGRVSDYYRKRYKGQIEQHDVLSAYGNKVVTFKKAFIEKYHLQEGKKTVVIMCHVFADAPHVYLNTLYNDYWEWFECSLNNLLLNPDVNILVKEHPSSHLYFQKGIVKKYLNSINKLDLMIDDHESTESILESADIVVTCGGTIGMEFSYRGKNVVLASNPPYGQLGFTTQFDTRAEYEAFLRDGIQRLTSLSPDQLEMAKKVSYISFYLKNNYSSDLELGGESILMGKHYDNSSLYNNILEYNKMHLQDQNVFKLINAFVKSDKKAMLNNGN